MDSLNIFWQNASQCFMELPLGKVDIVKKKKKRKSTRVGLGVVLLGCQLAESWGIYLHTLSALPTCPLMGLGETIRRVVFTSDILSSFLDDSEAVSGFFWGCSIAFVGLSPS